MFVDALRPGTIIHGARSWSEPSGKGVNVALALQAHQRPTVAVLPVGGPAGAHLVDMLERAGPGLPGGADRGRGPRQHQHRPTRRRRHQDQRTRARRCRDAEGDALLAGGARPRRARAGWVAGCGSLPGGLDRRVLRPARRDRPPRGRPSGDRHLRTAARRGAGGRARPDQAERRRAGRRRRRRRHHHRRRRRRRPGAAHPRREGRAGQPRRRRRAPGHRHGRRARQGPRREGRQHRGRGRRPARRVPLGGHRRRATRSRSPWPGAPPPSSTTARSSPPPTTPLAWRSVNGSRRRRSSRSDAVRTRAG